MLPVLGEDRRGVVHEIDAEVLEQVLLGLALGALVLLEDELDIIRAQLVRVSPAVVATTATATKEQTCSTVCWSSSSKVAGPVPGLHEIVRLHEPAAILSAGLPDQRDPRLHGVRGRSAHGPTPDPRGE